MALGGASLGAACDRKPAGDPEVGICGGKPCPGPRPPGGSIANTKMCSCRACAPERCCNDLEYTDEPSGPTTCSDSYDFAEGCGMQVKSCTPRCFDHVWRVKNDQSCEDKPGACCG